MTVHVDPFADERFVVDHARFLRRLVRGVVDGADDADDAAQEAWLAALEQPPPSRFRLAAWLAVVARRVAGRMRRGEERRERREAAAARSEPHAATGDVAARAEMLRVVTDAVVALDEPYRSVVVRHYYEGLTAEEIARLEATPIATVRSRLQRAKGLLRERLRRRLGDDLRAQLGWIAAWPGVAAPVATAAGVGATLGMATTGVTIVTMGAKVGAAAAVAIVAGAAWWLVRDPAIEPTRVERVAIEQRPLAEPPASEGAATVAAERAADHEEPSASDAAPLDPAFGSLRLRVVWERDGSAAVDLGINLFQFGAPPASRRSRCRTDERGELLLDRLHPGTVAIESDLGGHASIVPKPGDQLEATLTIPRGYIVRGRVVDPAGVPVARASIWCSEFFNWEEPGVTIGTSDVEGRFELPTMPEGRYLSAIKAGLAPSPLCYVEGVRQHLRKARQRDGTSGPDLVEVVLTMGGEGAALHGVVFAPDGRPAADVVVRAKSRWIGDATREQEAALFTASQLTVPSQATTSDGEGRFAFVGLQPFDLELAALREGCAPWSATIELSEGSAPDVAVRLTVEGIVEGRVVDGAGTPVDGASVHLPGSHDPQRPSTKSASDGTFRLVGLPTGAVVVETTHPTAGKGSETVMLEPGVVERCELVLEAGLVLRGRVVDEEGAPAAGCNVRVHDATRRFWHDRTCDAEGRFLIPACVDAPLLVEAMRGARNEPPEVAVAGVRAGGEERTFVLGQVASIRAVIVDSEGRPASTSLVVFLEGQQAGANVPSDPTTGVIEVRGLAPGDYRLKLRGNDRVERPLGTHHLDAGQRLDLGTIALGAQGRVRLQVDGERGHGAFDWVTLHHVDGDEERLGKSVDLGTEFAAGYPTSLHSGDYRVIAWGRDVATISRRIHVAAGEESVVELTSAPGVRCAITVDLPDDLPAFRTCDAWIEGDDFRARLPLPIVRDQPQDSVETAVRLQPGRYRLVVEIEHRFTGDATIDVAAGAEPKATIVVR